MTTSDLHQGARTSILSEILVWDLFVSVLIYTLIYRTNLQTRARPHQRMMEVLRFLVFLAALTGATSDLVFKKHFFFITPKAWSAARDYCKENYFDLSIIDTQYENVRFIKDTSKSAGAWGWIGLKKNSNESQFTQWCDGTALTFTSWYIESVYVYTGNCISTLLYKWFDKWCDMTLPFYCYSEMILVEEMMTWDEASQHCRSHYTDLISFSIASDTILSLNSELNVTIGNFWIGLRFLDRSWVWVNKERIQNLASPYTCPNPPFVCGAQINGGFSVENRDCNEKMNFVCFHRRR